MTSQEKGPYEEYQQGCYAGDAVADQHPCSTDQPLKVDIDHLDTANAAGTFSPKVLIQPRPYPAKTTTHETAESDEGAIRETTD